MHGFAQALLRRVEPLIYGDRGRRACVIVLTLLTTVFFIQSLRIEPDASFERNLPLTHPYMQVFKQYQSTLGGANTILVALIRREGTIYEERFLGSLRTATDEVFFTPGIDRARVTSIFTRNVRYVEVVEGGMEAADVIPSTYSPSPQMFTQIRASVAKAGVIGRLVTTDQRGAIVSAEVLERDPVTNQITDYPRVAQHLEDQLRQRFSSPTKYQLKLKSAHPPFEAGTAAGETFAAPDWRFALRSVELRREQPDRTMAVITVRGRDLEVQEVANPDYNPEIDVHIIGFAKIVGDIADATLQVLGFFALTVAATMLALWWYLGSLRLALLPLGCSLVAVIWEFGLLRTLGFGLDPFAILVPFLVLAVSTSHGVQYVNTWADEVVKGFDSYEASRLTFRRLFVPGTLALITNVAGFLTIALVPIDSIRGMSLNACLGMFAVIVTNKVMMPVWLSYLRVSDLAAFREQRQRQIHAGDALWHRVSAVTEKPVAASFVALSLVVLAVCWWYQDRRIIGDAQAGVPELRPDSVYNRDVRAISDNFAIGTDLLKVIAETEPSGCVRYEVLDQIDRFVWRMINTPGVTTAVAFSTAAKQIYSGLWELNPKLNILPRNSNALAMVNQAIHTNTGLLNPDCSAMPVFVFTHDHKAPTIASIAAATERFNAENAQAFFSTRAGASPAACQQRVHLRRVAGVADAQLEDRRNELRAQGVKEADIAARPDVLATEQKIEALRQERAAIAQDCPVEFALASGNVGVMAATNEVVEAKELPTVLWVYAVIAVLLILSYRSWAAMIAICVPLFMVSVFANALMAFLGIGLKVATLPVVALAVGVGVDYGIYIYDVLHEHVHGKKMPLRQAYFETLRRTGKAVLFTGACLAGGVAAWLFSDLQFQRDMGLLLVFMFTANMLGAVLLLPAYCRFLMR